MRIRFSIHTGARSHVNDVFILPDDTNLGRMDFSVLRKMLVALKVDPNNIAHDDAAGIHDLQRLCVNCGQKRQCAHELEVETATENYREFYPNAYMLDALFKKV
jgi:hypothetical protein